MKTLVLWLSMGLLLRLALSPAWGQLHHQEAVGAQGHERRGQPPAEAPDIPVDDLGRGTPRRALVGFRQAVRARDYQRAPSISTCATSRPRQQRTWGHGWPVT